VGRSATKSDGELVIKSPGIGTDGARRWPELLSLAAAAAGWLLALGGLIGTISALSQLGLGQALPVAALCVAPPSALWMTRRTMKSRHMRAVVPARLLEQRTFGRLEAVTDSERRSLRPIATSAYEVAARTGDLLMDLVAVPGVRIFRSVQAAGAELPPVPHAVTAGRHLVFIESVAWPPGHYVAAESGRIFCDGTYIGQSARPLIAAVQHWRRALPRNHHVSAMVVVHGTEGGIDVKLPAGVPGDLTWVHAGGAIAAIRQRIPGGRPAVSRHLVAALIAAIAD
jgi:hypothetical protein